MPAQPTRNRCGFTIIEVTITMAVTAVLGVIVAQLAVSAMRERAQLTARQAALELAANVLETARARPWQQLDAEWASAQKVSDDTAELLPEGKLVVTV